MYLKIFDNNYFEKFKSSPLFYSLGCPMTGEERYTVTFFLSVKRMVTFFNHVCNELPYKYIQQIYLYPTLYETVLLWGV